MRGEQGRGHEAGLAAYAGGREGGGDVGGGEGGGRGEAGRWCCEGEGEREEGEEDGGK